jgi:GntR family transcriptional regulator
MEFQEQKAIYLQIAEFIEEQILTEQWHDRLPAIRELAADLKVNPNTVARTYTYLETQGVITTQRGIGYFVEESAIKTILKYRKAYFLKNSAPRFLKTMRLLNISFDDLKIVDKK